MARFVPFQKWRIFFWTCGMAVEAGKIKNSDPEGFAKLHELVELGNMAYKYCQAGRQDEFLEHLRDREAAQMLVDAKTVVDKLLDDSNNDKIDPDAPDWWPKK